MIRLYFFEVDKSILCRRYAYSILFSLIFINTTSTAQLVVNSAATATQLANQLTGPGISISNVTLTGDPSMTGNFTASGTNLGLGSGIMLCTGPATIAIGPNVLTSAGQDMLEPGDADLDLIANAPTFDACILEFDFVPQNSLVTFRYVFASEEYPEYVCSQFNDVFAFYISGPGIAGNMNMAIIPGTSQPVAINTVNSGTIGAFGSTGPACVLGYSAYYVDNTNGTTIEFDGFTAVMEATAIVTPCETYHLRLAIADAGDGIFDSGVFLEEGSLSTIPVVDAGPDVSFCSGGTASIGSAPIPGWTYSWNPSTGLSDPAIPDPDVTLTNSGGGTTTHTYVVEASNGSCVLYDTVVVTVTPGPSSDFAPLNPSICDGQSIQLDYTGSAPSGSNFTWDFGGGTVLSGSGQGPYDISFAGPGSYQVSLTVDNAGCTSTTTTQVTVTAGPVATFTLPPAACIGDTLQVTFTGTNVSGSTLQWNFGSSTVISGSGTGPYELTFPAAGNFQVTLDITAPGCSPDLDSHSINIGSIQVNAGADAAGCTGSSINLGAATSPGLTYSWSPAAGLSNPASANPQVTLSNPGVSPDTIVYTVTASDGTCTATDAVEIIAFPEPVASISVSDDTVCAGSQVQVDFTGTAAPGASYFWDFGGAGIASGSGGGPYQVSFPSDGTYPFEVYVTQWNCTSAVADAEVIVTAAPVASFTIPPATCLDDTITVSYTGTTGNSASYQWTFPGANVISGSSSGPYELSWSTAGWYQVSVDVVTPGCPPSQFSLPVNIIQLIADAGNDVAECAGTTVSLGTPAQPGLTYSWSPAAGVVSPGSAVTQVSLSNSGSTPVTTDFILTISDGMCASSDTVSATANPVPVADAGIDAVLCSGDAVQLGSASVSGISYSWSPSGGLSSSSVADPVVSHTNSGTSPLTFDYILTTGNGSCVNSDTVAVVVNPVPSSAFTPLNAVICAGQQVQVSYTGNAGAGATFNWTFNGGNVISGNSAGPYVISYASQGAFDITLSVTENGCPSAPTVAPVTVNAGPTANFSLPQTACAGDTISVTYTGNGAAGTTYQWNFGGATVISGTGQGPYQLLYNSTGQFQVDLTVSSASCTGQWNENISVLSAVVNAGSDVSICSGTPLQIGTTPLPGLNYSWTPSTGLSSGVVANPDVIHVNNSNTPVTMNYVLTANAGTCVAIDTVNVTINPVPTAGFSPLPDTICTGQQVNISFTGTADSSASFNWNFPGGTQVTGSGIGPYVISYLSGGTYGVSLSVSQWGCNAPAVHDSVVVSTGASAMFSAPSDLCPGDTAIITYTGSGNASSALVWDFGQANVLSGTGIGPYHLSFGSTGQFGISLTAQNAACPGDTSSHMINVSLPSVNAGDDVSLCSGEMISIGTPAQGNFTYTWSPATGIQSPSSAVTGLLLSNQSQQAQTVDYVLTAVNNGGCENHDTVSVTIKPVPDIALNPVAGQCLQGNIFNFDVASGMHPSLSMSWDFGSAAQPQISSGYPVGPVSYNAAGIHQVNVVYSLDGCPGTPAQTTVEVYEMPPAAFQPNVTEGCVPLTVNFINLHPDTSGNFQWSFDGQEFTGVNASYTFNSPGTYDVTLVAENAHGCRTTMPKQKLIHVYPVPEAAFENTPGETDTYEPMVYFDNRSHGATDYSWDFGDGQSEDFISGYHLYSDTGEFNIMLIAVSDKGCIDTAFGRVRIETGFSFYVPNAFTPNGDGDNDFFRGSGTFLTGYEMWIYNRWGELLYYTDDYDRPWDGKINTFVQNDTYVYRISVRDQKFRSHVFVGSVTLVK